MIVWHRRKPGYWVASIDGEQTGGAQRSGFGTWYGYTISHSIGRGGEPVDLGAFASLDAAADAVENVILKTADYEVRQW